MLTADLIPATELPVIFHLNIVIFKHVLDFYQIKMDNIIVIVDARLDYCNSPLYEVQQLTYINYSAFKILWLTSSQAPKTSILCRFSKHFIGYQLLSELRIRSLFLRTKLN